MKYSDPDGREDEDLSNLKKQATQDLLVLKDNLNSLLNEIDSENLSEGLKFAAKNNLGLDITNESDLSVLKHDIGVIKETADNIDDQNLVITPPLKEHPFWKMYVNKNDETHKINITKLSSLDRNLDPALFHEMTHFSDSLGTKDNYDITSYVPTEIPKQERLKTAQCWTQFYSSYFRR